MATAMFARQNESCSLPTNVVPVPLLPPKLPKRRASQLTPTRRVSNTVTPAPKFIAGRVFATCRDADHAMRPRGRMLYINECRASSERQADKRLDLPLGSRGGRHQQRQCEEQEARSHVYRANRLRNSRANGDTNRSPDASGSGLT